MLAAVVFNSLAFLWFFLGVVAGYFALRHRWRWVWLLVASAGFYMAFIPAYILVLCFTILVDYVSGLYLAQAQGKARRWGLYASLGANLGVLATFKYYDWLAGHLAVWLGQLGLGAGTAPLPYLGWVLPLGLSFHTFQALSYTLEVYHGRQAPERHLGRFALYVLFYPQLVAGPIERPQHLLPQFRIAHRWDGRRVLAGLQLMAWGLFKKVAVADRLAPLVDSVFSHPMDFYGSPLFIATALFAVQIYADFSGYADMAVGAAQVMGFDLTRNFDRPYFAHSVRAFWSRWHISLTGWFRDYVYIPLGGSRVGRVRQWRNVLLTFGLSGLWHGAGWTFPFWGGLNGGFIVAETLGQRLGNIWLQLPPWLRQGLGPVYTFLVLMLGWPFFRAETWREAYHVVVAGQADLWRTWTSSHYLSLGQSAHTWWTVALVIGILFGVERIQQAGPLRARLAQHPWLQATLTAGLLVAILLLGVFEANRPFIYFQF